MPTRDEVLNRIRSTLVELFGLDPQRITPTARLYEDLEIDSIDVVDLLDHVRRYTHKRVAPEDFRTVRTINDLTTVLQRLLAEEPQLEAQSR